MNGWRIANFGVAESARCFGEAGDYSCVDHLSKDGRGMTRAGPWAGGLFRNPLVSFGEGFDILEFFRNLAGAGFGFLDGIRSFLDVFLGFGEEIAKFSELSFEGA